MPYVKRTIALIIAGSIVLSTGCGSQSTPKGTSDPKGPTMPAAKSDVVVKQKGVGTTVIVGAKSLLGETNLKKFKAAAERHPRNYNAQITAAHSAYVNGKYMTAIDYYRRALAVQPRSAEAYDGIGNVYFRRLNQPKEALVYYKETTQVNPLYAYGWINLALCEEALGNQKAARAAVQNGLHHVPRTDPLYPYLGKLLG
ncbi:MAG: tetratricopeptide repeat protein [Alicyclobacillus sp.]|nr:tetratricopeptide repeat protein [Alicyclobacillus sp.]